MRRTASETQLSQEEAEADYKDFLFYSRVFQGISQKQHQYKDGYLKYETERTIALHFMCKALDAILTQHFGSKTNVGTTLNIVFDNAVAKRDWRSDPVNARQELEIKQPSIKLDVHNGIIQ